MHVRHGVEGTRTGVDLVATGQGPRHHLTISPLLPAYWSARVVLSLSPPRRRGCFRSLPRARAIPMGDADAGWLAAVGKESETHAQKQKAK
jgi:hypothetical protein